MQFNTKKGVGRFTMLINILN